MILGLRQAIGSTRSFRATIKDTRRWTVRWKKRNDNGVKVEGIKEMQLRSYKVHCKDPLVMLQIITCGGRTNKRTNQRKDVQSLK